MAQFGYDLRGSEAFEANHPCKMLNGWDDIDLLNQKRFASTCCFKSSLICLGQRIHNSHKSALKKHGKFARLLLQFWQLLLECLNVLSQWIFVSHTV